MTDSYRTGRLAPVTPATDALFVYGTLRFPRILTALLGRAPAGTPATVSGWRTAALRGRPYPGLVRAVGGAHAGPAEAEAAPGLLLRGLSTREWRALDDFEDDDYELRALPLDAPPPEPSGPTPATDPLPREAWAYIWVAPDQVRADTWEAEVFAARQLDAYAARLESAGS